MKKVLFFATVLIALYSCSDNDYVGDQNLLNNNENGAISFNSNSGAITRAAGAEAATLLNNNFVVEGIKTVNSSPVEVFDNYNVNYTANTADKTASNTANWEYVNQPVLSGKTSVFEQTIKYWDYAATQYDFWAYSLGGGSATVSPLDHNAVLATNAYTFTGSASDLSKVFISDLVTAYNPAVTGQPIFKNQVNLNFRSLVAKVRVGLYETIPGYSIRNVQFYTSDDTKVNSATLYTTASAKVPTSGVCTVSFPTSGSSNVGKDDYNKAHISVGGTGATSEQNPSFGTLSYGPGETGKHEKSGNSSAIWLARTTNDPTWAVESGKSAGDYSIILPNENGSVLTLKVDYTLESTDGSGETITVHGATALVPAEFTQWKSNYAYTYIFKISDNTNGLTNPNVTDKSGLYPITFDAVVVGSEDGTQETITTVATPSITTYSLTSNVTTNDEYTTSDDIYVTATENGTFINMAGKATLYTVSPAGTEAEVLEALTKYSTFSSDTYTGRNGITLAPVSNGLDLTIDKLPTVDGQTINVSAGKAALIKKSELTANTTYAFVFNTTPSGTTPTTENKYEAVKPASGTDVSKYYNDNTGATPATGLADGNTTYYDKYTVVSGASYAIKVIKVN